MMPTPRQVLQVRSARDRLIDLLGIGETYPLQDVAVQEEQLTVSFDEPSEVNIDPGQKDVLYELFEGDQPVSPPCTVAGNGENTDLKGPVITKDRTFRIRASKILASKLDQPERFLFQTATVKVGLNTKLRAWIANVPLLHPELANPTDKDPRIADHGSVVEVRVAGAQAGADYQLVYLGPGGVEVSTDRARGTGAELSLPTKPVGEDTTIRIRVTRTFDPSEGRTDLTAWLDAALPLAVRANPALDVSIDGSPLVDPAGDVTVAIAGSQRSVVYSAYVRTLLDEDFEVDPSSGAEVITVSVAEALDVPAHDVLVHRPARPTPWQVQDGYAPRGGSSAGNGTDLKLAIGPLHEDSVIVIQAHKDHPAALLGQSGQSGLQLQRAAVALARPHQAPALTLAVTPSGEGTSGTMLVTGGQPGVFYHFRERAGATEIGLPAYFHRVDEKDPELNRGLEQLRIETDLVVTRDPPPDPGGTSVDLAHLRPLAPLVDIKQLPPGDSLSVMAVKARTGVAWFAWLAFDITTLAITINWTNPAGGPWSTASNWSLGRVPQSTDSVVIALEGTYRVTLDTAFAASSLTVGGATGTQTLVLDSCTLTVSGAMTVKSSGVLALEFSTVAGPGTVVNQGTLTAIGDRRIGNDAAINARLSNQGLLVVHGSVTFGGAFTTAVGSTLRLQAVYPWGSALTVTNGFTNTGAIKLADDDSGRVTLTVTNGTLLNATTGTITVLAGCGGCTLAAALDNQGTVTMNDGLTLDRASSAHTNSGTIDLSGGHLTVHQSGPAASFTNKGTVTIGMGRTLTVSGGMLLNATTGTITALAGAGGPRTLAAELDNQGTLAVSPGKAGTLAINGSLTTSGTLHMELGGTTAGTQYDQIVVSGAVTLGGTLNVTLINSFTPVAGNSFTIMTYGSLTGGTFTTCNLPAGVTAPPAVTATSVVLHAAP